MLYTVGCFFSFFPLKTLRLNELCSFCQRLNETADIRRVLSFQWLSDSLSRIFLIIKAMFESRYSLTIFYSIAAKTQRPPRVLKHRGELSRFVSIFSMGKHKSKATDSSVCMSLLHLGGGGGGILDRAAVNQNLMNITRS